MEENLTAVTEFIFLGFSDLQHLQPLLFILILLIYLLTLIGNGLIIAITVADLALNTPMYFFLRNLSILEICYTSTTTTVPQMLVHLLSGRSSISYARCAAQLYFFLFFVGAECILLASMAYDRYVAICKPLRYTLLMNRKFCVLLVSVSWLSGALNAALHTFLTIRLPFCEAKEVNYFYCDIPPLLALSCGNISFNVTMILVSSIFLGWSPTLCIGLSYGYIVSRILKIHSPEGRSKAFSTCVSHLTAVLLYYGSSIFTYVRPLSSYSLDNDRLISLLYNIVTPMLNPLIYTLRNKDVKRTMKKVLVRKMFF
uniref:Olfactory receptor n=1 Tax=Chelydra serpentina TaxID=8475 RepID=A0A8C3S9J7_CHESE